MRPSRKINIEHFFHNIIFQKISKHPVELHSTCSTELNMFYMFYMFYGIKIFGINPVGKFSFSKLNSFSTMNFLISFFSKNEIDGGRN